MRVGVNALFIRTSRVGGAETMVHNLVRGLQESMRPGDSVAVFTPSQAQDAWPRPGGQAVNFADVGQAEGNRFIEESRLLRRHDRAVDVWLHTNYFTPPALSAPSVTVIHDEQFRELPQFFSRKKRLWLQAAHRRTSRVADHVVCISGPVAEGVRLHRRRALSVIHNPVSWERFAPFHEPGMASGDGPVVLAVAAQYPHKRLDLLLRAWQLVEQAHPSARLELVGQTSENLVSTTARSLPGLASELGLRRITFRGYLPDDRLGEAYARATVFAHPSNFEGFGLPVVESLGLGVPVVATDLPVFRELVPYGVSFVDPRAGHDTWAGALLAGLAIPRLSASQSRHFRDAFSPSQIGSHYWDVFDEVVRL